MTINRKHLSHAYTVTCPVPVTGKHAPHDQLAIDCSLLAGGVTCTSGRGAWVDDAGVLVCDEVIVYSVTVLGGANPEQTVEALRKAFIRANVALGQQAAIVTVTRLENAEYINLHGWDNIKAS